MFKNLISRIPEKYRIIVFLVSTSLVGVSLILVAVYNASSELEVIHEIENIHRFATAQLDEEHASAADQKGLLSLSDPSYQILVIRDEELLAGGTENTVSGWRINLSELNESRVNEQGGYLELDEQTLVWALLPAASDGTRLLILHRFTSTGFDTLLQVYTKRILVPALFYIWLMIWMGYIVRYLTKKLSEQQKEMERMALHDTLTGLPNRNLLSDRLSTMLEVAKRDQTYFTVVMMDLDGFKDINDTFGHAIGDILLKEVAVRMSACMRPHDTVCRLGGDEFIFLLDDKNDDSSMDICKRISDEISRPYMIQGNLINIGSSMGVVKYTENDDDPETLIHKADQAMYLVKAKGGGIHMHVEGIDAVRETLMSAHNVA